MKPLTTMNAKAHQQGVILLLMMLVLFVAGSSVVIGALNNRQSASLSQRREVQLEMERAKAALLAYAANYGQLSNHAHGPGFFPCPDIDNDANGAADFATATNSPCNSSAPMVGRLPVYEDISGTRFEISSQYAGIDDRRLWYVVAPRYVYPYTSGNRRSYMRTFAIDTPNFADATDWWLTLDGDDEYVAFIIDPGEELEGQSRASGPYDPTNYLDGLNGAGGFDYYTSYSGNPALFNDRILGITFDEYMVQVGTAVARTMKSRLDAYNESGPNSGRYPLDYGNVDTASSSCSAGAFRNIFTNPDYGPLLSWLRRNGSGNTGERWSCSSGINWVRDPDNPDAGILKFNGCPGLSFTFQYSPAVTLTRTGTGC